MKRDEITAFLDAEKCLISLPSKTGFPGAKTRWDDLQAGHVQYVNVAHDVVRIRLPSLDLTITDLGFFPQGAFLPWHRYYIHAHMELLRTECGYEGIFPYWEQRRDIGAMEDSSLFDRRFGMGGNGQGEDMCVVDGPFANMKLNLGPGYQVGEYCLNRRFNTTALDLAAQANIDECYAHNKHVDMTFCMENNPHIAGHLAVGGVVSPDFSQKKKKTLADFFLASGCGRKSWWSVLFNI
jgi:tyrosinase